MATQILQGRFEIETQLSCTDFSTTYIGCDRQHTHRPRCLITAVPYRQREIRHRLEREAQKLAQLGRHAQMPRLLTYFYTAESKTEGIFYLVEDYIEGHSLRKELTTPDGLPKQLSESYVAKLLQDALAALAFAHEKGSVHQSLHPQHLIRQKQDGRILITGFGAIAKIARSKVTSDGTLSSTVPITPSAYIAPEQLRSLSAAESEEKTGSKEKTGSEKEAQAERNLPASDLYSLGLIAIEALTGKHHSEFEYAPGSGLKWREAAEVSLPLAEFIDRMVRQAWRDRFPDAKEALETLKQQRDRHAVANDSRMPTVVAAPRRELSTTTSIPTAFSAAHSGAAHFGSAKRQSAATTYLTTSPHPYLHKLAIGSIAVVLALGIGVKTYQWGEYRVSQLPQSWRDWRDQGETYVAANPQTLAPLLADGSILLQPSAANAFWQMVAAAKDDEVALYPIAGYFSAEGEEGQIGDYATGYVVDIGGAQESTDRQAAFAQTPEFQWLRRNAKTYGFELSAPKDRLLGGAFEEPWHWRYVGDEASQKALGL